MELLDSTKSLIENLYFLSGPVIASLGIAGIIQLALTKKAIIIASRREAAKLSTEQIEIYNTKIIPLQNKLFALELKEKIPKINIEVGEFNYEFILKKLGKDKLNDGITKRIVLAIPFLDVINSMEVFATYFIKGVADEEIAFSAVGQTFCYTVNSLYFDIATSLQKDTDFAFQNVITLYDIWSKRLKLLRLSKDKEKLLKEIDGISNNKIDPIGTK